MSSWTQFVEDLAWMALNASLMLVLAPLVDGFVRKLAARLQGRIGPPIIQPYRDLRKLLARTITTRPIAGSELLYKLAPVALLSVTLCACSLIPTVAAKPVALSNFILVFYLLALSRFISSLMALNVPNPFAAIASSREHLLALGVEPAAMLSVAMMALATSSPSLGGIATVLPTVIERHAATYILALAAFSMVMVADLALPPFDIAEAEQEIYEGIASEYGGPYLALIKLCASCKRVALMSLLIAAFVPFGMSTGVSPWIAASIALYLAKLFLVATAVTLLYTASARLRIVDVPRYLLIAISISMLSGIMYLLRVA